MHLPTLVLALALLAAGPRPAGAWSFGKEWTHHSAPSSPASFSLLHRIVLPRNDTNAPPTFRTANGTSRVLAGSGTRTMPGLSTATPTSAASNTTTASTTTNTTTTPTTTVLDTTCGQTAAPFQLRLSQPGAAFDQWWLRLSGNSVLFTAQAAQASEWSVEASGHMCAVGRLGAQGYPEIAVVETRLDRSVLYFVDANSTVAFAPEYEPVSCKLGGGRVTCGLSGGNGTAAAGGNNWVGCGLMLELGGLGGADGVADGEGGFNCTSVALNAVYSS